MDEKYIQSFENILTEEEKILDLILDRQNKLHKSVNDKNWEALVGLISEINTLSDNFQKLDSERDRMQEELKTDELKQFSEKLLTLRNKLLRSKVENQALGKYISIARGFVQGIIDNVVPGGNKVYNKKGIVQNQPQSVVLSVTM